MRKRDLHILTSHIFTYTGDGRFGVHHPESSDDWNLKIEFVQARDAGIYECQVNTEPKINMAVMLNVEGLLSFMISSLMGYDIVGCHKNRSNFITIRSYISQAGSRGKIYPINAPLAITENYDSENTEPPPFTVIYLYR
jgi:hypothetical protein